MRTIRALKNTTALMIPVLASGAAFAAAPKLHVTQSIEINASAHKVWKAVESFDSLNTWHPAVAKDEIVEGKNDVPGAVRLLTLKDGGTIKEKLLAFEPQAHKFRYEILEGVLPVSDYRSTVSVVSAGKGKSTVTWTGNFRRKDTGDNPADNANDKTATDTITGVYQGGLQNLKKMLEGG
jgi:mxaD protein